LAARPWGHMKRTHIVALMILIVAVPAAAASSFIASNAKPCFVAGNAGYQLSAAASANYTVHIDHTAAMPSLRMQLVDDPAAADFVLVDDSDAGNACKTAFAIRSVRIDQAAPNADLTVALSRAEADTKIYVRSANFSEQDAAALFAVIWLNARRTGQNSGLGREFAERH
jgi:hypothetical protein